MYKAWALRQSKGFTIVELLIVIVVIGILSAIVIVAYRGIQSNASDAIVKSDETAIFKALRRYKVLKGNYPQSTAELESMADAVTGYPESKIRINTSAYDVTTPAASNDTNRRNLIICVRSGPDPRAGIASLSKSGKIFFYTSFGGPSESTQNWIAQQSTMCPRLGIATTDPGYARSFGYERSATQDPSVGWKPYTNGE
ncbi:MAG: type II secretion system protein [Candidatus Saccharimonadales bacterium]